MKTTKKLLSILLCALMVLSSAAVGGEGAAQVLDSLSVKASAAESGTFTYSVTDGKATITDCDESVSGELTIPEKIDGYPVTAIDKNAFSSCSDLTGITIPDSVTTIDDFAFRCEKLARFTVDSGNPNYSNDEYGALFNKNKTELIQLPREIELTEYIIPDSVEKIKNFYYGDYYESLKCIHISPNVTSINWDIGYGPYKVIDSDPLYICSDSEDCYAKTYADEHNIEFRLCTGHESGEPEPCPLKYSIENGEVTIDGCDRNYKGAVVIPAKIEGYPVTTIGGWAFEDCTGLKSVTIPDSVTVISSGAFKGCTALTGVIIPGSVTAIENWAFEDCAGLTSITVPDSVTRIDSDAFRDCTSLTEVTIGKGLSEINFNPFFDCTALEKITVDPENGYFSNDEYGVLFNKDKTELIQYPIGSKRTSYSIPDGVTYIGSYAFHDCPVLTSVDMPDSLTTMELAAFEDCTALRSADIPDGVTCIENELFYNCTSLEDVHIPESAEYIGSASFYHCAALKDVTFGNKLEVIGDWAFDGCKTLTSVVIPDSATYIGRKAFMDCTGITSVVIGNGVEIIRDEAFYGCTALAELEIGSSVNAIYTAAFGALPLLTSVTLPDSIEYIGDASFLLCPNLKSIVIGKNARYIGGSAFAGSAPEFIHIPSGVEEIGEDIVECSEYYGDYVEMYLVEGMISEQQAEELLSRYPFKVCICSDSEDCLAKTYAEENGYDFRLCSGHKVYEITCEKGSASFESGTFADDASVNFIFEDVTGSGVHAGTYIPDENYDQVGLYSIRAVGADGKPVQPQNGKKVTIELKLPEEYADRKDITIIHWFDNGGREKFRTSDGTLRLENGYAIFEVGKFSEFSICVDPAPAAISIRNMSKYNGQKLAYRSTVTFRAELENCTDIEWYVNGRKVSANEDGSCTVTEAKEDIEICCTAKDASGNQVKSETEKITVKHGFFDKLIAFFKGLFKSLPVIEQ